MSEFADKLDGLCAPFFPLSGEQLGILEAHYALMVRWNRVLNLTRVVELDAAVKKHYGESVFLAAQLPTGALRIADVGSGPGFPGVPVAVCRPDCSVTLIESHQRKAAFLKEATRRVQNISVIAARAADVKRRFDWVVSRAVRFNEVSGAGLAPRSALLMAHVDAARLDVPRGTSLPWDSASLVVLTGNCST